MFDRSSIYIYMLDWCSGRSLSSWKKEISHKLPFLHNKCGQNGFWNGFEIVCLLQCPYCEVIHGSSDLGLRLSQDGKIQKGWRKKVGEVRFEKISMILRRFFVVFKNLVKQFTKRHFFFSFENHRKIFSNLLWTSHDNWARNFRNSL